MLRSDLGGRGDDVGVVFGECSLAGTAGGLEDSGGLEDFKPDELAADEPAEDWASCR